MKLSEEKTSAGYGPQAAAMHLLPLAANLSSTACGPIQTPDVLLRNTMKNEWRYSDDDRYTMKSNLYSPFSTLWIRRLPDHGMENIRTGLRPRDPLPRFTSAKPRARM